MTLLSRRGGLAPALIVPDEQTWTMLGRDPAQLGAEPSFEAAATVALLLPAEIPEGLDAALRETLAGLPGGQLVRRVYLDLPASMRPADRDPEGHADGDEGGDPGHGVHEGGHGEGHGDMMAIVGDPSADGLIMEPIELRYGPLAVPLPGGLTIRATLDGELVSKADVSGLAMAPPSAAGSPPAADPLNPAAWASAMGGGRGPADVGVVELERAISHLAWLRALSRLLGWARLTEAAGAALEVLTAIDAAAGDRAERGEAEAGLAAAGPMIDRLVVLLKKSRSLRWRLAGRGVVAPELAEARGLRGPSARASGLPLDERRDDPRYAALGYETLLEGEGDALARTVLRAREAAQSVGVARAALAMDRDDAEPPAADAGESAVEGPRGPLRAQPSAAGWRLEAPGAASSRALAAELMVGQPWGDALAVLASFDLSPWEQSP